MMCVPVLQTVHMQCDLPWQGMQRTSVNLGVVCRAVGVSCSGRACTRVVGVKVQSRHDSLVCPHGPGRISHEGTLMFLRVCITLATSARMPSGMHHESVGRNGVQVITDVTCQHWLYTSVAAPSCPEQWRAQ